MKPAFAAYALSFAAIVALPACAGAPDEEVGNDEGMLQTAQRLTATCKVKRPLSELSQQDIADGVEGDSVQGRAGFASVRAFVDVRVDTATGKLVKAEPANERAELVDWNGETISAFDDSFIKPFNDRPLSETDLVFGGGKGLMRVIDPSTSSADDRVSMFTYVDRPVSPGVTLHEEISFDASNSPRSGTDRFTYRGMTIRTDSLTATSVRTINAFSVECSVVRGPRQ